MLAYGKLTVKGDENMLEYFWYTLAAVLDHAIMTANPWYLCLLSAAVTSIFGAYTELVTRDGNDTLPVPVVNAAVLWALQFILYH